MSSPALAWSDPQTGTVVTKLSLLSLETSSVLLYMSSYCKFTQPAECRDVLSDREGSLTGQMKRWKY
ncbi:hypothetical protein SBDP1_30030 [Syntrophobacter sp. SbD1]|nr:hypothetical protein SBDP1_30030 [Syntrophobacter sp. SbD1]